MTEAIAPYSPTTIYGQLTSPFTPKTVTINAHTPYDKVDEEKSEVFSRDYFKGKPQAKIAYELPEVNQEFPPKNTVSDAESDKKPVELTPFSASSASSSDIVQSSLKRGYTPQEAVALKDAQNAYKNSAVMTKDPTGTLSTCSYRVF